MAKKSVIEIELDLSAKEKVLMGQSNVRQKKVLINEIKTGLGKEIKKNPGKAKIIKKTRTQRFMLWLKKIFTKF
jgi:hypothetical protein